MRVFDIVAEEITNEAPMGTLSKLGNTVASKFGSGKASGRLETGQIANQLRKEFDVYLGKTGQDATPDSAIAFLKTKGYPTAKAQAVSSAPTPAATNTPIASVLLAIELFGISATPWMAIACLSAYCTSSAKSIYH